MPYLKRELASEIAIPMNRIFDHVNQQFKAGRRKLSLAEQAYEYIIW